MQLPVLALGAAATSFVLGGTGYLLTGLCRNGQKVTKKTASTSTPSSLALQIITQTTNPAVVVTTVNGAQGIQAVRQQKSKESSGLDAIIDTIVKATSPDRREPLERTALTHDALILYFKTYHSFTEAEFNATLSNHILALAYLMLRAKFTHQGMGREFWYCMKKAAEEYATDTRITLKNSHGIDPALKKRAIDAVESFKREVMQRHIVTFAPVVAVIEPRKKKSRIKPPLLPLEDVKEGIYSRTRSHTKRAQ